MTVRRIAPLAAGILIVFGVSTAAANAVTPHSPASVSHSTVQAGPEPTPTPTASEDDVTWGG